VPPLAVIIIQAPASNAAEALAAHEA